MPNSVGIVTPITIYGHDSDGRHKCDYWAFRGSVMRCSSAANDFVYRYDDCDRGVFGFCGMNV